MRWLARRQLKANFYLTRVEAIIKLEKYGRSEAPLIASMLSDRDSQVRAVACHVLGRLKDSSTVQPLGDLMLSRLPINSSRDDDPHRAAAEAISQTVTKAAAKALGQIGDLHAVPLLIEALDSTDFYLCAEAVTSLGNLRATAAVEPLIRVFNDVGRFGFEGVIQTAIAIPVALAKIGGERANEFVLDVFRNSRRYVFIHEKRHAVTETAFAIWNEAARGYPVDQQVLSATQALAEKHRRRNY